MITVNNINVQQINSKHTIRNRQYDEYSIVFVDADTGSILVDTYGVALIPKDQEEQS